MRTVRLVVEYDGTEFAGWQEQANLPTVQGALQDAVASMVQKPTRVRGASRTDAGVHARGQVAAFDVDDDRIPLLGFLRGLNTLLPPAVAVRAAEEAPPGWDPRRTSRGKRYVYTYWEGPVRPALERHRAWHVRGELELEAMTEAAQALLGTHDFESFRAAGCVAEHAVRTLYAVHVDRGPQQRVALTVVGNAFLRNMVRIIAGHLAEVGLGRRPVGSVAEALAARDRTRAGITAPAAGLTLDEVIYDDRLPPRPRSGRDRPAAAEGGEGSKRPSGA